jgi:effector-binding domain-containing protein
MTDHKVEIKDVPAQMIACIRDIIANYRSAGPLYEELMVEIDKHNLGIQGAALAIYYDPDYTEKDVDIEVAIPVSAEAEMQGERFKVRRLAGHETMASLTRVGPWDDFTKDYQILMEWIQAQGWRIIGPNREIYLKGPESGVEPEQFVVEIQFPVVRA